MARNLQRSPGPSLCQGRARCTVRTAFSGLCPIILGQGFQNLDHCYKGIFFPYILSGFPLLQLGTILMLLLCVSEKNLALWEHLYPCSAREYKGIPAKLLCVGAGEMPPPAGVLMLHRRTTAKMKVGASPRSSTS